MYQRQNNLDQLINHGYMSQRTKSPRKIVPNNGHNQFYQNTNQMYANVNKINSNRDMSPNKMFSKNKPLLNGFVPGTFNQINHYSSNPQKMPLAPKFTNFQIPIVQSQNKYVHNPYDNKNFQFNTHNTNQMNEQNWKTIKSPRSPQAQNLGNLGFPSYGNRQCYNHHGKKAEYMTQTEGQRIYYCQTCAAKLASKNFQVIKLPISNKPFNPAKPYNKMHNQKQSSRLVYKPRQIPNIPQYKGNAVYESIIQFLKQITKAQKIHYQNYNQLQSIEDHYDSQMQMVDIFYQQLLDILQRMRRDHLNDLNQQKIKSSQIKDIYINQITQNLQAIEQIVNDLDENFYPVITKVTNQQLALFNQALEKNRNNIKFYINQIQQQKDTLSQITSYKEERLQEMVGQFEKSLLELWIEPKKSVVSHNKFINQNPNNQYQNGNNSKLYANNNHQQAKIPPININQPSSTNGANKLSFNPNLNINMNHHGNSNILQNVTNNHQNQYKHQKQKQNQKSKRFNILNVNNGNNGMKNQNLTRDFQGKGACRQIFEDDQKEQALTQQVSPKFKNI